MDFTGESHGRPGIEAQFFTDEGHGCVCAHCSRHRNSSIRSEGLTVYPAPAPGEGGIHGFNGGEIITTDFALNSGP